MEGTWATIGDTIWYWTAADVIMEKYRAGKTSRLSRTN